MTLKQQPSAESASQVWSDKASGRIFFVGLLLSLALALSAPLAFAQSTGDYVGREIGSFSAGVVCSQPVLGVNPAPGTVSGSTNEIEVYDSFQSASRRVPAILGLSFGVLVRSKTESYPSLTIVVTHPPMGANGATEQIWTSWMSSTNMAVYSFRLEHDYELVEGPWAIEGRDGDTVLFRAEFEVVSPSEAPELTRMCGFENLLS